jgi:SAM-dependent methyltransferase
VSWIDSLLVAAERMIFGRARSDLRWWRRRAQRRGIRSVFNLAHSADQLQQVTEKQIALLFPILQQYLRGDEKLVLDFGCGPGRFTSRLAALIRGRAIGVDPIARLLELAPRHPSVEYRLLERGIIPVESNSVDVVWICLVLMTITDANALQQAIVELRRVLRPGGLVFLVENTDARPHSAHLHYRSTAEYTALMPWAHLQHVCDYEDAGERISVLVGRRA